MMVVGIRSANHFPAIEMRDNLSSSARDDYDHERAKTKQMRHAMDEPLRNGNLGVASKLLDPHIKYYTNYYSGDGHEPLVNA